MVKKIAAIVTFVIAALALSIVSYAGSYSSAWYKSGNNWYIKGPNGNMITNAWVCDNAAGPGAGNNWYLIESNGVMVTAPLVQDGTGHFYSLETQNNGNYGMLRYTNGTYDGIPLTFNQNHDGSFGAITNPDGINALAAKYGVYNVAHINNNNIYYTASYINNLTSSSSSSTSSKTYTIYYYADGSKVKTQTSESNKLKVISYNSLLQYWYDENTGDNYYPGEYYYFSGSKTSARLIGVFSGQDDVSYTVEFIKLGSSTTKSNTSGQFTIPSCSSVNGNSFAYWEDEYGNHWSPGEIYTSHSSYDVLTAIFYEEDYGDDSGYYDDDEDW